MDAAMQQLTDILNPEVVRVPLDAANRKDAIRELVELLCQHHGIPDPEQLTAAIWQREQTRTTGIGFGVAIPHGKLDTVDKLCMAVGKADTPIDFQSIDGKPVELIFLLASPLDQTGPHIQALASISKMLSHETLRDKLKHAESAQQLYQMIAAHDPNAG